MKDQENRIRSSECFGPGDALWMSIN